MSRLFNQKPSRREVEGLVIWYDPPKSIKIHLMGRKETKASLSRVSEILTSLDCFYVCSKEGKRMARTRDKQAIETRRPDSVGQLPIIQTYEKASCFNTYSIRRNEN